MTDTRNANNGPSEAQNSLTIRGLSKSNVWDYENAFYWFSHPSRLNKLLAHYDLYRNITNLPGDIFELGVYKAASLVRLATFRNLLENNYSRKIVGFDAFGKFPVTNLTLKVDIDFIECFEKAGGNGLALDDVDSIFKHKNFDNILLNEGNVFDTLPKYLEKYPATRIAFLHLDMDVKEPTTFALNLLYDRVVPGGLIVLDDYNAVAGETDAVDEFLKKHHLKIEKTTHYSVPSFIRKSY
ncbi:TylF/MycF/NovP-related O-methyltransferase [Herbaspirillum seropedicae]|uniref:TylF/MycF/NovP-related O-methyltransferase n=1 Tax=Herbaspirillum seropedicae TaxID=964 RepID=UPI00086398B0|nr:TylF/MycF/NovP-related O-methyltransferase [Herbaspirillum seropedicae]AON54533.1 dTDP-6-deoxy-L-hexose 3-O-methyltransferase [Herbaspirillum seropedicae]MDR6394420.1 hypothetical protein [Herbaspirillum seropedicae]